MGKDFSFALALSCYNEAVVQSADMESRNMVRQVKKLKRIAMCVGLLLCLGVSLVPSAIAQTAHWNVKRWGIAGGVTGIAETEDKLFIGGTRSVGPNTGSFVLLDPTLSTVNPDYPQVAGRVTDGVPDGAGGWIIGGDFTHVRGVPAQSLARMAVCNH